MTKYSNYRSTSGTLSRQEREKIHPIWRGIGLILVFLFAVMGWFGSIWLLDENAKQHWITIPSNLMAKGADELLYVKIGVAIVIFLVLYMICQFISFFILRLFGPERYGPMDIPRASWKGSRKDR